MSGGPRYGLEGQAAIVTGAGRGIGRSIARRLAREGVSVAIADVDGANAAAVASEIEAAGGAALAQGTDVTQRDEVEAMVAATVGRFGRLDILVNNAGVSGSATLLDTEETEWNVTMAVNAKGALLCSQAAARRMIAQGEGGRIINMASTAGKQASGEKIPMGSYVPSKHALIGLTRQLGLELARHQILVNCICPGIVDNEGSARVARRIIVRSFGRIGLLFRPVAMFMLMKVLALNVPLGRMAQEEEVAAMVAFLASPDSSYSTGQAFNMSGGQLQY